MPLANSKCFTHAWTDAEYMVLLQVNMDQREEVRDNLPMRHTVVSCVLECALARGLEVPDEAYAKLHKVLAESIKTR
jgi:hypothetical protein